MSKLLLVCSSGGHLYEMNALYQDVWSHHTRTWVTFRKPDAESILIEESVRWAFGPTHRNLKNLIRNTGLAFKILREVRPDVIISTGSGIAVPFLLLGKTFGIKVLFIESVTRTRNLSLTGRLLYPFVDKFLVQSNDL